MVTGNYLKALTGGRRAYEESLAALSGDQQKAVNAYISALEDRVYGGNVAPSVIASRADAYEAAIQPPLAIGYKNAIEAYAAGLMAKHADTQLQGRATARLHGERAETATGFRR